MNNRKTVGCERAPRNKMQIGGGPRQPVSSNLSIMRRCWIWFRRTMFYYSLRDAFKNSHFHWLLFRQFQKCIWYGSPFKICAASRYRGYRVMIVFVKLRYSDCTNKWSSPFETTTLTELHMRVDCASTELWIYDTKMWILKILMCTWIINPRVD